MSDAKGETIMDAGYRDAIHVPFVMVTCRTDLEPGTKVSLRHGDTCVKWTGKPAKGENWEDVEPMWHGVADPFRETAIPSGELFPVYIRKECFGKLRHDFEIVVQDRGGTETCHSVCNIF